LPAEAEVMLVPVLPGMLVNAACNCVRVTSMQYRLRPRDQTQIHTLDK
jgi:hypothetical protein